MKMALAIVKSPFSNFPLSYLLCHNSFHCFNETISLSLWNNSCLTLLLVEFSVVTILYFKGDFVLCLKTGKFCLISRNTHFLSFLFIVGYSLLTYLQLLFNLCFSDCDANVFAAKVFTAMVVLVLLIDVFAELVLLVPQTVMMTFSLQFWISFN